MFCSSPGEVPAAYDSHLRRVDIRAVNQIRLRMKLLRRIAASLHLTGGKQGFHLIAAAIDWAECRAGEAELRPNGTAGVPEDGDTAPGWHRRRKGCGYGYRRQSYPLTAAGRPTKRTPLPPATRDHPRSS